VGRWAQYRKRGRATPVAFALSPPIVDVDFHGVASEEHISVAMDAPCPDGADGVGVRWRKVGTEEWTPGDPLACEAAELLGSCDLADNYEVQCRWTAAGDPVSDWSASSFVVCE